jgi:undecaprenyl-diphosphatase
MTRDLELMTGLLAVALLALAFVHLSNHIEGDPRAFDEQILLSLREPHDLATPIGPERFRDMARDITALGSGTLVGMFSIALTLWLLLTRRPGAALFVAVAVLGGWLLNDLMKDLFARERPTIVPHLMNVSNASFPSGHAMTAAVLYPTMAELMGRLVRPRHARLYLMTLAIVIALFVGFTRIYLGVHYPSDVLGGLCAGFAWALLCGIVARMLQRRGFFRAKEPIEADAA